MKIWIRIYHQMSKHFDPQYWTEQIKKEIGLSHVTDDKLSEYFVDFGSFFSEGQNKQTAKQYVETQLEILRQQYDEFEALSIQPPKPSQSLNLDDVEKRIADITSNYSDEPEIIIPSSVTQLEYIPQQINRNSVRYFEVLVAGNTYIVAINVDSQDFRVGDHINHIKNTSFFVEERNPLTFTGLEHVISYYQFVNLIQPHLKPKNDFSFYEKIAENVDTQFDGLKLEGFE